MSPSLRVLSALGLLAVGGSGSSCDRSVGACSLDETSLFQQWMAVGGRRQQLAVNPAQGQAAAPAPASNNSELQEHAKSVVATPSEVATQMTMVNLDRLGSAAARPASPSVVGAQMLMANLDRLGNATAHAASPKMVAAEMLIANLDRFANATAHAASPKMLAAEMLMANLDRFANATAHAASPKMVAAKMILANLERFHITTALSQTGTSRHRVASEMVLVNIDRARNASTGMMEDTTTTVIHVVLFFIIGCGLGAALYCYIASSSSRKPKRSGQSSTSQGWRSPGPSSIAAPFATAAVGTALSAETTEAVLDAAASATTAAPQTAGKGAEEGQRDD